MNAMSQILSSIGPYQLVDQLAASPMTTLWTARRQRVDGSETAEAPVVALKHFYPIALLMLHEHFSNRIHEFLNRAELQQRVSASPFWAPVLECGPLHEGAFVAMPLYPRTLADLITARAPATPDMLYEVVQSIVSGLTHFQQRTGRQHGDLKPSNVLLPDDPGAGRGAFAVLTDPAEDATLARLASPDDFSALGDLIHQVVVHRRPPADGTRLSQDAAWSALGPAGEAWWKLCDALLSSNPDARPRDLADLQARLTPLRPANARTPIAEPLPPLAIPIEPPKAEPISVPLGPAKPRKSRIYNSRLVLAVLAILLILGGYGTLASRLALSWRAGQPGLLDPLSAEMLALAFLLIVVPLATLGARAAADLAGIQEPKTTLTRTVILLAWPLLCGQLALLAFGTGAIPAAVVLVTGFLAMLVTYRLPIARALLVYPMFLVALTLAAATGVGAVAGADLALTRYWAAWPAHRPATFAVVERYAAKRVEQAQRWLTPVDSSAPSASN